MGRRDDIRTRQASAVPRGVATGTIVPDRAIGAELWDVEGKHYIDLASGIAVLNVGHRHPRVVEAVAGQLTAFTHTCFHVAPYEGYIRLAERLNAMAPGDFPKKTMLVTTGAEAVENAIKIARYTTGRPGVVAFTGAFHGRTLSTLGLTGKVSPYKAGFGPFPGDFFHVPFPDTYRGGASAASLTALETLFRTAVDPERVAAIIIEPVQGEGGFNVAPPDFLRALRTLCDRHGILFIADEVQTGVARTGRLFAVEHADVAPDLMTLAKGLGGGLPIAAVVGRAELMDAVHPGGLGGTFAGNPLSCAAANAVLDVVEDEKLCERASVLGSRIVRYLTALADRPAFRCIGDVRGLGAMVAMELVRDRDTKEPDSELAAALVARAADKGVILLCCGVHGNVVRFLAPLTIPFELLEEGLKRLEDALGDLLNA